MSKHFMNIMVSGIKKSEWSPLYTTITDTIQGAAVDLLPHGSRGMGYGFLQTLDWAVDFISSVVVGAFWTLISPIIAFGYAAFLSGAGDSFLLYLTHSYQNLEGLKDERERTCREDGCTRKPEGSIEEPIRGAEFQIK